MIIKKRTLHDFVRTKIVATVGPACESPEMLRSLIEDGVNVFRINSAHGTPEWREKTLRSIRAASDLAGTPVGILVDLAGPKIRLGQLLSEPLTCAMNDELTFVRGELSRSSSELTSNYPRLIDELHVQNHILLADGLVRLEVVEKNADSVRCRVIAGGDVRSRQGINLPGVNLSTPALTEEDRANAIWAAQNGVEFISLSFVRHAKEIKELRELCAAHQSNSFLIAKIEKREALTNLDEIVQASDGIMVARGDLGVEIEIEATPLAQKRIIDRCQDFFRPVIVATQMLESMHNSQRPTRAEVSDVANAILDGADACMLSGETAIGQFPRLAVQMMQRILRQTESLLVDNPPLIHAFDAPSDHERVVRGVVFGAAQIARHIHAKLMVVGTGEGDAARIRSKLRDFVPTLGMTADEVTLRRMSLYWGIIPVQSSCQPELAKLQAQLHELGQASVSLSRGDLVVFVMDSDALLEGHDLVAVGRYE
jgi:pyruvate kinase